MRYLRRSIFSVLLTCPAGLYAQDAVDTIRYTYPAVTTTGTRLAGPWIAVPLAISYIQLQDRAGGKGYGLDEILTGIPGVLAQSRYGNQDVRITIRGFGARGAGARSNAGTTRGIRVLVDGFPETEPDGRTSFDLVDLAGIGSMEVVRSNVSSVYGNASGGVISISSVRDFRQPFAEAQSSVGSFGFRKEAVRAGTAIGAGRFYLSASNTNADGWREHSRSSQAVANAALLSSPGQDTELGIYLAATSNIFRIPGPLSQEQFDALPRQSDSTFIKRDERRFNRLGRLGVTISHAFGAHNGISSALFVSPKYIQRSERNRFRDFNRYHVGGNLMYRNEFMPGDHVRSRFIGGVDEAYQDGAILFYTLTGPPGSVIRGDRSNTLVTNKREGANNFGVFLQEELVIDDRITIMAGGRYDRITYHYEDYLTPALNDERIFGRFTPKGGFTYRFSPTHSIYANLGGGVEVPAGNETDPAPTYGQDTVTSINPLLEPITSTTLELGTKHAIPLGDIGSSWISYDVALYWIVVDNDIIPYSGGAFYLTAGRTRRWGVEAGANLHTVDGLDISAAVTATRNKYIEYTIDSVHYGIPGAIRDLAGYDVAGVPDVHFSVWAAYSPPSLASAYFRVGIEGVGSYFADDANRVAVPGHTLVHLMAGVRRVPVGDWYLSGSLGVNNLFGTKYAASAWINPDLNAAGKPVFIDSGPPRSIIGSIMVGYNL